MSNETELVDLDLRVSEIERNLIDGGCLLTKEQAAILCRRVRALLEEVRRYEHVAAQLPALMMAVGAYNIVDATKRLNEMTLARSSA